MREDFQGKLSPSRRRSSELILLLQIPVALAMWNQVTAEVILLIRTYAFFNRSIYILTFLVTALAGVVSYQLYVDTSQMLRTLCRNPLKSLC